MKQKVEIFFRVLFLFIYVFTLVPPQGFAFAASDTAVAGAPAIEFLAAPGPEPAPNGFAVAAQEMFASPGADVFVSEPFTVGRGASRTFDPATGLFAANRYANPSYPVYVNNGLAIEPIVAYNLVVDSNVLSPSSYGPASATVGAKFCNSTGSTMTNVWAYIGNYDGNQDGTLGDAIPGQYPVRNGSTDSNFNAEHPHLTGTVTEVDYGDPVRFFALKQESGTASAQQDASRFIGTLAPGECRTQYWLISYPRKAKVNGNWVSVAGGVKPNDDLWLPYFFWANAASVPNSYYWRPITMRNEISAQANKIWPNGDNKVPQQYVDAIEQVLGWDTITPSGTSTVYPGQTVTSQGIWYDLGNVGQGFDNNGDFVPDRNIWLQPIGDPSSYDPGCFRLVRTYGIVIVKLNNGTELLIPFVDQMYFENIPSNNTGAVGLVYYEYAALDGACTANLTPYQEVASGYDNEKFNGDFGAGIPPLQSRQSNMTIEKTDAVNGVQDARVQAGGTPQLGTINYTLTFSLPDVDTNNNDTVTVGNPSLGLPLVIADTVPAGTQYVGGSASASITMGNYSLGLIPATVLFSTNSGLTWSAVDPGTVASTAPGNLVKIQWWAQEPVVSPASGAPVTGTVSFSAYVLNTYTSSPLVENTACLQYGNASCFTDDTATTLVNGTGSISGRVWADDNIDGSQAGELGIPGVAVYLYFDSNGNGVLDPGEPLLAELDTSGTGTPNYTFSNLPAGDYIVTVNTADSSLPDGYSVITTTKVYAIDLGSGVNYTGADFGFGPTLLVDKILQSPNPAVVDELVTFRIDLINNGAGDGTSAGNCVYTVWAGSASTLSSPKNFVNPNNAIGSPDLSYATGNFATGSNKVLTGSSYNGGGRTVGISKVEILANLYFDQVLVDDTLIVAVPGTVLVGGNPWSTTFNTVESNAVAPTVASKGNLVREIPAARAPGGSWDWNDFASLSMSVEPNKAGGQDGGGIAIDALGFRVTTTDTSCADGDSTINPLPLTDTYDADLLEFFSAEPPVSLVSLSGTAPNTVGTLTWNNLGPLYSGGKKSVLVTFRALAPISSTINEASVTEAKFVSGRDTNDKSDTAQVGINVSGSIGGVIWADTNNSGWTGTAPTGTGYNTGDTFIPGVKVDLYKCVNSISGLAIPLSVASGSSTCASVGGTWTVVVSAYTDANGAYLFEGLRDGFYNVKVDETTLPPGFGDAASRRAQPNRPNGDTSGTGSGISCPTPDTCDGVWYPDDQRLTYINAISNGVSGENITRVSFGYQDNADNQGAVVGYVWNDANSDGIWDDDELPIAGVKVYLCTTTPCNASTPGAVEATTDSTGRYAFGNLAAGSYYVEVIPPSGTSQTGDPDQPNVQCTSCDNRTTVSVTNNAVTNAGNFGYVSGLSIGDTVYVDWNGDGSQDVGEEGIPNVTVYLYRDTNGNGVLDSGEPLIDTAITDAGGQYNFAGLVGDGAKYVVRVNSSTIPAGYEITADPQGAPDGIASVTLATVSVDNIDFGYRPRGYASIGDTIWYDNNGNGVRNLTEIGISGVAVNLYQDQNGDGIIDPLADALVATATTNSSGQYLFENLAAGTYIVQVANSNFASGNALDGLLVSGDPDSVKDGLHKVTVTGSQAYLLADFGYVPLGRFGDTVYWDANGNGDQDYNESGIEDVIVYLYTFTDTNNNGRYDPGEALSASPYATTVTDANGKYLFTSLPTNKYVAVIETGQYIDHDFDENTPEILNPVYSRTLTGDPDVDGVACTTSPEPWSGFYASCDARTGMQIFPGTNYMGADFGFLPLGVIGDRLWVDSNSNGRSDLGETGIANVDVRLYVWNDSNDDGIFDVGELGALYATATTDVDGYYTFQDIPDGKYIVSVFTGDADFPANLLNTYDPDGSNDSQTTVILSGGGVTNVGGCPTLPSGCDGEIDSLNLDADFGYQYGGDGALSGTICLNTTNTDGLCNGTGSGTGTGETPYESVTVYLYLWDDLDNDGIIDPGETTQVAVTNTDDSGNYSFANLPDGVYYIVAIGAPQAGLNLVTDADDTPADALVATFNLDGTILAVYQVVEVPENTSVTNVDFAFKLDGDYDFGDLPASYSTLLEGTPDGPRHLVPDIPNLYFGIAGDAKGDLVDANGQPSTAANADTSDDGVRVVISDSWDTGTGEGGACVAGWCTGTLEFDIVGSGWLVGWVDFNRDGDFADAGEMVLDRAVSGGTNQTFQISVPEGLSDGFLYARFRLFPERPVISAFAYSGVASNGEVEDYRWEINGGTTTPITLSYFIARRNGSTVQFEWSTATETANVGFNLYVVERNRKIQINPELIPSRVVDSLERQDYAYSVDVAGNVFYIEDVSIFGETRLHGPFNLGQPVGSRESVRADKISRAEVAKEFAAGVAKRQNNILSGAKIPAAAFRPNNQGMPVPLLDSTLNLKVNRTGIYRVTYEMLRKAGLELAGVPLAKITLTNRGVDVPIHMVGKAKFGPGSYFEFYGEALDTLYTDTNIYTVQVNTAAVKRVQTSNVVSRTRLAIPSFYTETLAVNRQRAFANYAPGDDNWYDTSMLVYTTPKSWNFPFTVTGLADVGATASLELVVWGVTNWEQSPDHHLLVSVNGEQLADEYFDGLVEKTIKLTLPAGLLREGANTLTLTLPGDTGFRWDMVNLDKFSVSYPRAFRAESGRLTFTAKGDTFRVTNLPTKDVVVYRLTKSGPVRIRQVSVMEAKSGTFVATFPGHRISATYLVSAAESLYQPGLEATRLKANLSSPAEYLVISHPAFVAGLEPLLAARRAQGLTVSVVDVNDLYAQYTHGVFDPQAIKDYVAYAAKNLGTRYVLLVGGDTYDYRNYTGRGSVSFIPSLYIATGAIARSVPVDPLYTDLNGDNLPDLAIGRFPVRTAAELDLMIQKTLDYQAKDYGRTALFATDKHDGSVSFKAISRGMETRMPSGWSIQSLHMDNLQVADARLKLLQGMNQGTALVTFTGHSGPAAWTFNNLFSTSHASALTNTGRPFVAVQWGCWNTYYIDPANNYLVHSLLFSGDRGAAAVLGAVTLTDVRSEHLLGEILTPRMVQPGMTIGDALQQSKSKLAQTHPELLDVLLGWTLMGDPALVIEP